MIVARDQENLTHNHQVAAASKPLNQKVKQLVPRTPGNKVSGTPFNIPINGENDAAMFGGGKTGVKTIAKGNENILNGNKKSLADKNAFVTPMGPRTRAPLGFKTTNAKAKVFQNPALPPPHQNVKKASQHHALESTLKLGGADSGIEEHEVPDSQIDFEEMEIEYMPPKSKDIPDVPDDIPALDYSVLREGNPAEGFMYYYMNKVDEGGLSHHERWKLEQKDISDRFDLQCNAAMQRDLDLACFPCLHFPECPGEECKDMPAHRHKVEETYQKVITSLKPERRHTKAAAKEKKAMLSKGPPSLVTSKKTPTTTAQPRSATALKPSISSTVRTKAPSGLISSGKQQPPPTNPSTMRHKAAISTSKTTLGYAKGRSASANLRKTILPKTDPVNSHEAGVPDVTLAPAVYIQRYGNPRIGSEMWAKCLALGCFEDNAEEDPKEGREVGKDFIEEDAEREFQLTF